MAKKKSLKTLKTKAAQLFQLYVRLRDTDENGNGNCCSCGKFVHYKCADAGHFVSRRFLATLFDERNVHLQCKGCNGFNNGCPEGYSLFLIDRYGVEEIERLNQEKQKSIKIYQYDYENMIELYTQRINEIRTERGLE